MNQPPLIPEYVQKQEIIVPQGRIVLELFDAKTGKLKERQHYKNLVTTVGKESIADGLRGNTADNKGIITYCAVGTGIVAPTLGDIALGTELFRKLISVREVENNIAMFRTFYTTSEANGSLKEAGLFGDDATSVTDSGTLFCRALINRTKTSNDTLSFAWTVAIG